ncbi:protein-disulfide reductase DsbD family protein [Sphingomonas sp. BT-65]|uniref:protein-disulfide reductase DsbD family protein n=1 Tax=Sphingomonas sp. BT-65 TaxID=2989821 RepID=UPI002235C371|nr:protein-disulfide reductase DsbD domain-containing protein [Sphingomonas sp. BT-65]MCW4463664.1 protein-disulfide reductase DsbD family protein [Sphingomonas sp. BT-65]
MRRLSFAFVTLLGWMLALSAPPVAAQQAGQDNLAVELVAETDNPAPGSEVALAFVATPDPGWHGYWKNPGDAGLDTRLDWKLPQGVSAGELRYPVPTRLLIAGIMNYVYKGSYTQLTTLKIPAGLAPGTALPVAVRADYLVCTDEVCVPETENLTINLVVGDGAISTERRARFDQWRRAFPKPLGSEGKFAVANGTLRIAIPYPAGAPLGADAYFFPLTTEALVYSAPQKLTRNGDAVVVEVQAGAKAPAKLEGVLAVGSGQGFALAAVPGEVAAGAAPAAVDWSAALVALGGALLGGLILNIMPCVFPILSLKALSLAKSGTSEGHARAEALAYTAGVVLVVLALGAVMLGLRAAGASVGWAFQLTDARVILFLLLLVLGIALNLAGLFELATPKFAGRLASGGSGGAFMTGALAAFIATPCTGPFMGAALGAALVLPWYVAAVIFLGLGLGLALPFLLLGFVPALRRMLPKPGAWMDTFRKILSVPMFLTAIALAWVLGGLKGVNGMAVGLIVALGLAVVLWIVGRRQARAAGSGAAWAAALLVAVAGIWAVTQFEKPALAAQAAPAGAEPFSEARLAALQAEGRPVFAYFTADWCVTCKVNEKTAIETDAVRDAFKDGDVAVLVGDWTDGDPALGRFIEKHNRAGVPLYLWYPKGAKEPKVLPQVLTQGMLAALPGDDG